MQRRASRGREAGPGPALRVGARVEEQAQYVGAPCHYGATQGIAAVRVQGGGVGTPRQEQPDHGRVARPGGQDQEAGRHQAVESLQPLGAGVEESPRRPGLALGNRQVEGRSRGQVHRVHGAPGRQRLAEGGDVAAGGGAQHRGAGGWCGRGGGRQGGEVQREESGGGVHASSLARGAPGA